MARHSKIAVILLLFCSVVFAAPIDQYPFSNAVQQADFNYLTQHLRCLVCSNQTIGESNAPLATDLRAEVYKQILAGQSREAILNYVVNRYGDYVLYQPPLKPDTYVLWFMPFILLLIGAFVLWRLIKKNRGLPRE